MSELSAISADGRHVAFMSLASNLDLDVTDNNQLRDIFVRDMQTGATARVSVQTDGFQTFVGSPPFHVAFFPAISGNGRFVSFTVDPRVKLVSDDNNGNWDVYMRDRDVDENGIMDETNGDCIVGKLRPFESVSIPPVRTRTALVTGELTLTGGSSPSLRMQPT